MNQGTIEDIVIKHQRSCVFYLIKPPSYKTKLSAQGARKSRHVAANPTLSQLASSSSSPKRTLSRAARRRRRPSSGKGGVSAAQHRDDGWTGAKGNAPRRSRVAVAGVGAPRVAMVLAVTRGAAALRRCTRRTVDRGGGSGLLVPVTRA